MSKKEFSLERIREIYSGFFNKYERVIMSMYRYYFSLSQELAKLWEDYTSKGSIFGTYLPITDYDSLYDINFGRVVIDAIEEDEFIDGDYKCIVKDNIIFIPFELFDLVQKYKDRIVCKCSVEPIAIIYSILKTASDRRRNRDYLLVPQQAIDFALFKFGFCKKTTFDQAIRFLKKIKAIKHRTFHQMIDGPTYLMHRFELNKDHPFYKSFENPKGFKPFSFFSFNVFAESIKRFGLKVNTFPFYFFIQQLFYFAQNKPKFHSFKITILNLKKYMPWMGVSTIKRYIKILKDLGLLEVKSFKLFFKNPQKKGKYPIDIRILNIYCFNPYILHSLVSPVSIAEELMSGSAMFYGWDKSFFQIVMEYDRFFSDKKYVSKFYWKERTKYLLKKIKNFDKKYFYYAFNSLFRFRELDEYLVGYSYIKRNKTDLVNNFDNIYSSCAFLLKRMYSNGGVNKYLESKRKYSSHCYATDEGYGEEDLDYFNLFLWLKRDGYYRENGDYEWKLLKVA